LSVEIKFIIEDSFFVPQLLFSHSD